MSLQPGSLPRSSSARSSQGADQGGSEPVCKDTDSRHTHCSKDVDSPLRLTGTTEVSFESLCTDKMST
eukprot:scaffold5185_cov23-Tisochrysis_lutea.AAC.1